VAIIAGQTASALMAIPFLACVAMVVSLNWLQPCALPANATVEGGRIGAAKRDLDD
jgi:hypothetical protein